MVWVPGGVLIAGTPPDRIPRVSDEEMPGEQVVMRGFYIDLYPYPNEAGAIPTTNMTWADAKALCEAQDKRLCTELELERACKGPNNTVYLWGDAYRAAACNTGVARMLTPNGVNASCASAFGVYDLTGSVWTWTASQWRRDPAKTGLVTLRGGNGAPGDLLARCANGRAMKPEQRREDVGVRCCAGEPNTFEVMLAVTRGEPLKRRRADDASRSALEALVPDDVKAKVTSGRPDDAFRVERSWVWQPLGNEELVVGGGCAYPRGGRGGGKGRRVERDGDAICGVVIARVRHKGLVPLAWVASEWWQPTLSETDGARAIYLYGGDRNGAFRRRVTYAWGKITVGDKERRRQYERNGEPRF